MLLSFFHALSTVQKVAVINKPENFILASLWLWEEGTTIEDDCLQIDAAANDEIALKSDANWSCFYSHLGTNHYIFIDETVATIVDLFMSLEFLTPEGFQIHRFQSFRACIIAEAGITQ